MADLKPGDAPARDWTDSLPPSLIPYARLSRLDRPVGWQLLFMPCLMGIALAAIGNVFWPADAQLALLLLVGAVAMRGAGCTWNDILDRDLDAQVARTRARPIPAGQVSVAAAAVWMGLQCLIGLWVLLSLPTFARWVALGAVPLVALYPLMKRITWWPQAWLGLCFSWGALVAVAAVNNKLDPAAFLLFAGCAAWVIAYDTIYALQDKEDDALVGVRSTARLFGQKWRVWTLAFYLLAFALWSGAAALTGANVWTAAALGSIAAGFVWPTLEGVNEDRPGSALGAFKRNVIVGLLVAAAFAVDPALRMLS